ncbi:unnamed protein product [Orchesella dallaii]|uniref:tRNA (32-2'-O)-methyltransferase regulator THADA n=1 Tax=Orchesella dallaii TaxID=48710 RepID=A0ABP1R9G4_9HEXA
MEESDLLKNIDNLQERLKCLKLVDHQTQQPSSLANEIRTALKNIGAYCAQSNSTTKTLLPKIHATLRQPLLKVQSNQGVTTDGDISSILSYLKLLSEIIPPVQSKETKNEALEDTFWNEIIEPVCKDILDFINSFVLQRCLNCLSSSISASAPAQNGVVEVSSYGTGFAFHQQLGLLQKGLRILLIYLKRATSNLTENTEKKLDKSMLEIVRVLCVLMNPKTKEDGLDFDVGLDIRCNIGIAISYSISYAYYPNKSHIESFFNSIFTQQKSNEDELLSDIERGILEITDTDVNRLSLAFGILNTWLEQEPNKDIFLNIGKNVLDIEHGVKEAVNLGSARILEIWSIRLANPSIPLNVVEYVAELYPQLEFFCFMYMPGHIDAVKNCCRNTLSALAAIYDRLDDEGVQVPENKSEDSWVSSFLRTVLGKPVHIRWLALSCIAKKTQKSLKVLELEPDLPESLFCAQRTFKSAANDTYVALMSYHFQTVSEAIWGKTWVEPLFATQLSISNESNWPQKRSIISIILNSEKLRIPQIQVMIIPLLKRVLQIIIRRQVPNIPHKDKNEESLEEGPEASLLAAETIKMAYELKITIDPKELNFSCVTDTSKDSFRGLVPRPVLNHWLWSEDPQIRLAGLALLVETKKTSEVITRHDFESLKIFFKYNLLSQNSGFRQQFMSYFKKLVRRLRDGESVARRKKDMEVVQSYLDFIKWLWHFFTEEEGLFYGANFGRRCQALECLSEFTETFSTFELFGITRESDNCKYLRWLTDTYEHNKIQALEVLVRMPIKEFEDDKFCSNLLQEALGLCQSVKPPDSITGRYLVILIMRKHKEIDGRYSAWNLLDAVYQEMHKIYEQIEATSLTKVSSESPLYGCVRCIRMIFQYSNEFKKKENSEKYRSYVEKLVSLCFKIDDVMFPVLGSAAPEGFLPTQQENSSDKKKQVVRSLASQMLLVCAWRTMKEISLLMSDMCSLFIMEGELASISEYRKDGNEPTASLHYLLTFEQVCSIGDHLLYLLKNLIHRGVFEQVYVGFKIIATRLWKSSNPNLSNLPEKWLQDAMDQEHISSKSITRRSAGLPFIFQALLSAESDNEVFLHKWLQRLLIFDESPDLTPIRIHSMNVLRGLFRDASFSAAIMPFVPHGLKMAFRGLKSLDWNERNSGLMLYGAVMRRSFGPKLNLMNAPTFFRKFPQMYDFLLEELDTCIQTIKQRKLEHEATKLGSAVNLVNPTALTCDFTFHLLLLLASFTSSGRVEDSHFKLAEFIPRITKCGESDDMEVRKLAAKALIPFLVSPEEKRDLAMTVLDNLQSQEKPTANHLHGLLFQFLTIASQLPNEDTEVCKTANAKIVNKFLNYISMKQVTHSFKAPTVYETVAEIFEILHGFRCVGKGTICKGVHLIEQSYFERFGSIKHRNFVPGLSVADARIARAILEIKIDELEKDQLFELVYTYLKNPDRYCAYVQEFFELCQQHPKLMSTFCNEASDESLVLIETVLESYHERASSLFKKFPGTQLELGYLKFMENIPTSVFENSYSENEGSVIKALIQRLFQVCEEDESTTLQVKSVALTVLGRILFSTTVPVSDENKTRLCDILVQWSTSGVDDDMRLAVAETFPSIPFQNLTRFTALQQSKIWCSIFLLAQDDESFYRQIIDNKLSGSDGPCCDRKSLEVLTKLYFHHFLLPNPIEGLLLLIGLLVREDFEVEVKAADDETEDRLFDKSEMNMYFEHETLCKTFKLEMEVNKSTLFNKLKPYLDTELSDRQIRFYEAASNNPINSVVSKVSIRTILSLEIKNSVDENNCERESKDFSILTNNSDMVKYSIQQFLAEFLKLVDQS